MKERPILLKGEMVRAILEGRKTQTRRIMKPQPEMVTDHSIITWEGRPDILMSLLKTLGRNCPFGQSGDRLWVRETTEVDDLTDEILSLSKYSAGGQPVLYSGCDDPEYNGSVAHWWYSRDVCPSIHMPRWASRILLEVTGVRVERLQDISGQDALAEGVGAPVGTPLAYGSITDAWNQRAFASLWQRINGKYSWDANPWVWVVEFKRIESQKQATA